MYITNILPKSALLAQQYLSVVLISTLIKAASSFERALAANLPDLSLFTLIYYH